MDEREIIEHVTVQSGLLHVKSMIHLNSSLEIPESNRLRILALTVWRGWCSGGLDCVLSACSGGIGSVYGQGVRRAVASEYF